MTFYEDIKNMRKQKGYTLREVADKSGVSPAYISQLENGNRGIPSPEILMKLSEGLDSTYEQLMQLAGYIDNVDYSQKKTVNLRHILRDNRVMLDGVELSDADKQWIEQILTLLFQRERENNKNPYPASKRD